MRPDSIASRIRLGDTCQLCNMSNLVSLNGAKNSFTDSATQTSVCDNTNTSLLVMDCNACECCEVCCDGENDAVCDFQLDVRTVY